MRTIKISGAIPKDHWLREFHERLTSEDLSPFTVQGYLYDLNHFRRWLTETHGREPALEQLLTVDVAAYRQYLVDVKRLKASSVNRRIQTVKKLFSWAHTAGFVGENPAKNVRFMSRAVRIYPRLWTQGTGNSANSVFITSFPYAGSFVTRLRPGRLRPNDY
jgi:site-specific recombinase XerD